MEAINLIYTLQDALLHHLLEAAHLPLDPAQPKQVLPLAVRIHAHRATGGRRRVRAARRPWRRRAAARRRRCGPGRRRDVPARFRGPAWERASGGVHGRPHRVARRRRRLLLTTLTELKAMAAEAMIGLSRMPNAG